MRTTLHFTTICTTALLFAIFSTSGHAQFQRQYGTALDESFSKVIPSGTNYYVLGQGEITEGGSPRAIVSRLNAAGELQWTLSLNTASIWNDAVITPSGNLMVVGNSLPDDNTSRGIMGLVTSGGAFTWVRSYDLPQRDGFWRIVRNAAPQSAAFPYYVLGSQTDVMTSNTDMFLLNLNESGTLNWKKLYFGPIFFNGSKIPRDLVALPNGDLLIAANLDAQGVIMRTDNGGQPFNGVTPDGGFIFKDIALGSGGSMYAVGTGLQNGQHYLMKYDADLIGLWDVILEGMTEIHQVLPAGGIYVLAKKGFKECANRISETGGAPTLDWVKFLDNGFTTTTPGALALNASSQLAFADGRTPVSGGFGQLCAFVSLGGPDMDPCFTSDDAGAISPGNIIYSGPLLPDPDFYDVPPSTNLTGSLRAWQQAEACATCEADFSFQFTDCNTTVSFTNLSTGSGQLSYFWNFGYSSGGIPATSVAVNPVISYPAVCASYNVCLTVTGNGCTDMICKTITIKYPQTPVLTCPPNITVACNTSLLPSVTGFATLTGACSATTASVTYSDVVTGNMPCNATVTRTWTAMDECGVTRTCVQTITVRDNVPPTAVCALGQGYVLNPNCTLPVTVAMINAGSFDNCQIQSMTVSPTTVQGCGVFPITLTVMDICGNTSVCVTGIQTIEGDPPMIMCPPNITLSCDNDISPATTGMATATDHCDPNPVITFADVVTGTLPCNALITRTWTARDNCGNESTCVQLITIIDNVPPVAGCVSGLTIVLDPTTCTTSVTPAEINDGSGDNCQIQSGSVSPNTFTQCGAYAVTLTVFDACNNSSSCTTTVQVTENVPPVIMCPPNIQVSCGANISPSITGVATATDNCDPVPVITFSDVVTGTLPCNAIISRTWTATDNCNNTTTCVQIITVLDNISPTITCPQNVTVSSPATNCTIAVQNIGPLSSTDNCSTPGVSFTITGATLGSGTGNASGTIFNPGTSTVTYTATDACNNTASCSFDVIVQCGTAICCPEFSLVKLDSIMPCDDRACMGSVVGRTPIVGGGKIIACKNSVYSYYVVPNLPGFIYNWTVTGGTLASATGNPGVITWGSSDEGFFEVIITDASGTCRDTITQEVCLIDAPVAGISVQPGTTICTSQSVTFTNTSVGATSHHWDFGDGTTSTSANPPPHTYSAVGTYTVLLTVSNNTNSSNPDTRPCGCKDTATVIINVIAGTGPEIIPGCKKMLCPSDTASYCVNLLGCTSYTWTVNGGTIIANNGHCITVEWDVPPATFPASVSVTTSCSSPCGSSATLNVPVLWDNIPISGPSPVCVGATETYSLPTMPGTFYSWNITPVGVGVILGPNQNTPNISVQWNGPVGTATITCVYNNPYSGCSGDTSMTVLIRPNFAIVGPAETCAGLPSVYGVTTGLSTATWTISPGTPGVDYTVAGATTGVSTISVNWITPGSYTVTAVPTNPSLFCNASATVQTTVKPNPVLSITAPQPVCPGQLNVFSATSSLSGADIMWSVTGGGTASSYGPDNSNASVTLTGTGTWTVTVMQTVDGCFGSATLTIPSVAPPVLTPSSVAACIGGQVQVTASGGAGAFNWDSSPAATLISGQGTNTATYEIHGPGMISVSNCGGKTSIPVSTTTPPSVSITQTGLLCAGNAQLDATAGGVSYQWFGGGTPVPPNSLAVTTAGIYTVQITSSNGCISTATYTVMPEVFPSVSISTGDALVWCLPDVPNVLLQAFTVSTTGCNYQWYDASGPIGGAVNQFYTATAAGSYYVVATCGACVATSNTINVVQITCTPASGCTTYPIPPNPYPFPNAIVVSGCKTKTFSVNVAGCSGGTVMWHFGDGGTATGNSVTHTYTQFGVFPVTAEIECNGCKFAINTKASVPVEADFNYSVACGANGSYTVTLNNTSQTLGGWTYSPSTDVTWTSSCGTPLSGTGNVLTLNTPANCNPTVTMTITVTDPVTNQSCTDSKTITLNLPTQPLAIVSPAAVCKGQISMFNYNWTGPAIVQHEWTVGGTPVSQNATLNYTFVAAGTYTIDLTITDIYGCTYTDSDIVTVVMPRPLTLAPVMICPDCLPPTLLSATPSNDFTNYQWYQNGVAIAGATNPSYQLCQFDASGNYYVTAEDTQFNNCPVTSDTVPVTYHPKPTADIQGSTIICVPANVPYNISLSNAGGSNSNYTYNWMATGPGAVTFTPNNTQFNADATVTALGTYEFILTVTDLVTGCMAKDTFCVYLCAEPMVTVSGPAGSICAGTSHTFTATATPPGNYVYVWSNGATGPVMTTSQAGTYSVTATDTDCGCSDDSYAGFIKQTPSTILFPCGCDTICDNETITPPLALGGGWPGSIAGYQIQWYLSGNPNPFYTGPTLNLSGGLPAPLVYGLNNIYIIVTYQGCSDTSNVYNLFIKKCCECRSELTISHGGNEYPVFCNPHTGFIPSLPCPEEDVIISGFHGFVDPLTGEPCEETDVIWELVKPDGSTQSGITTNFTSFIFFKDSVAIPGSYCLNLTTISPDGLDTCVCKVIWVRESCDCCTTLEDFCARLENNVSLSVDNNLCKVTLNVGNLPPCDVIDWIDWDYPNNQVQQGPFPVGSMPMHTYPAAGTYTVCYLAIERDANGMICFEKLVCDTITVECPDCYCGTFSALFFPLNRAIFGSSAFCNAQEEITIACPPPGKSIQFTGLFQCAGTNCPPTAPVTWALYRLPNTTIPVASGSTQANPYFGISILPAWYATPGSYELRLVGHCGLQECPCIVRFRVDCPDPCPCNPPDIEALSAAVNQGFAVVKYPTVCKACFVPVALSDCETVEWHLNTANGPLIGNSVGNNAICHTFNGPGTYTVVMVVTRRRSDGSICEVFTKSQTVTITCLIISDCTGSDFPNPAFSLGAVGGGLLSGGMSNGWGAAFGEPVVVEGAPGSFDAWTIQLSGNLDSSAVLTSLEPICVEKSTGMLSMRMAAKRPPYDEGKRQRPCDVVKVTGSGWSPSVPASGKFAFIPIDLLDSSEWVEIEIPYDLTTRTDFDTCGMPPNNGVWIQLSVEVTNALVSSQGGEDTYSYAQLDNLCFDGTLLTATNDPSQKRSVRLYPNPTPGQFTLELPAPATPDMRIRIIGLTGQTMLEKAAETGAARQLLDAGNLPSGLYFVQVWSEGRIVGTARVVKQN